MYQTSETMVENKLNLTKIIRGKVHITSLFYKEVLHNCGSVCVCERVGVWGGSHLLPLSSVNLCCLFFFF